jgi:hypothetical protein
MSDAIGTLEQLAGELARIFEPLARRVEDGTVDLLPQWLGLRPSDVTAGSSDLGAKLAKSAAVAATLVELTAELVRAIEQDDKNAIITTAKALLSNLDALVQEIRAVSALFKNLSSDPRLTPPQQGEVNAFAEVFVGRLLDRLLVDYLQQRFPQIVWLLIWGGVIEIVHEEGGPEGSLRGPYTRKTFHLVRVLKLFTNPTGLLQDLYKWGAPGFDGLALFLTLQTLLREEFHIPAELIQPSGAPPILEAFGFSAEVNRSLAPPGLDVSVRMPSSIDRTETIDEQDWLATIKTQVSFQADLELTLRPFFDVTLHLPPNSTADVHFAAEIRRSSKAAPFLLLGAPNSTRLEIQQPSVGARIDLHFDSSANRASVEPGVDFKVAGGKVVVDVSQLDGFLAKILPGNGLTIPFDLEGGWAVSRGFYFKGGAGIEATLPINVELLGVIKIDSVYLALEAKENSKKKESGIRAVTATTVKVQLGPVSAIVERFGLQATLTFPEKGGNLGVANLDLGFKPPNGVGVVIKAQVVTGGGYLYFDVDKEQYAGVLQLEIAQKFSLTAVGLLTTKMPDGSKGFSLLVIISVRFDPGIQLGYGFSLNGLGGLLGVNRTAKAEVLREGLRHGALGSILFPQNVVENAPQIISNLSAIFPPAKDRFLFGPMAIIGWGGSPPLLSMEIGIILELPDPFRLIILGRLRVTLPSQKDESTQAGVAVAGDEDKKEDTPKIKLQLDSLGIIDFGSGDISLDAFLYDSTIGPFTITGGMALRISFGAKPLFLLSVGGYHPAFQAPAGFPSVERVSVGISKNQNGVTFRLQLSAYFALTSNTVQFGSRLDLYVHVSGFEITGLLGFDVLIQFQPFRLIASFEAMVAVKAGSIRLMSVSLQVKLEGPSPWHAWGKAQFEIVVIKASAEFSVIIGSKKEPLHLPPPIDVEEVLRKELENPSNWTSHLPLGENPLVTFGRLENSSPGTTPPPPSKQVLIHPLAELHINQRLVPLNAPPLDRYGHATPKEKTTFTLTVDAELEVLKQLAPVEHLSDWFARAQLYDMTDDAKLAAPSFEQMNSGLRLKAKAGYTCGTPIPVEIEPASRGDQNNTIRAQLETSLPPSFLSQVAHLGAAGQAPIRASGPARYRDPAFMNKGLVLNQAQYRVVGGDEQLKAQETQAVQSPTPPSKLSAFEEAQVAVTDMGEAVMSYSAAQARVAQARAASPHKRMWIVPDIRGRRGQR